MAGEARQSFAKLFGKHRYLDLRFRLLVAEPDAEQGLLERQARDGALALAVLEDDDALFGQVDQVEHVALSDRRRERFAELLDLLANWVRLAAGGFRET